MQRIEEQLKLLADEDCRRFNEKIVCTSYPILGVRIPKIRKLSSKLLKELTEEEIVDFRPETYEGVILKGLLLGKETDLQKFFTAWEDYLPYYDSWAQVDTTVPSLKIMKERGEEVLAKYASLALSERVFDRRFLVVLLMSYFLKEETVDRTLQQLQQIKQGDYYVDTAIAWALSVVAVKFYGRAVALLQNKAFQPFVHNKAIQKCRESLRLSAEQKAELTALKRK